VDEGKAHSKAHKILRGRDNAPNPKAKIGLSSGRPASQTVRAGLVHLSRAGRIRPRLAHLSVPSISHVGPRLRRITDAIGVSAVESVEGLSPEAARYAGYNFRRGVLNGVVFSIVDALISPSLVLAWFVNRLGAPNVLVGLLPAILSGGWFLPQLLVAGRVQGLSRVMPWYTTTGILRTIAMALIALFTVLLAGYPQMLLVVFFVLFIIYGFSAGVSGVPWLEIVGKVISPRRRGSFFGMRSFWGGLLALAIAGPVAAIASERLWGLTFPYNFALLFALATIGVAVAVYFWSSIKEPASTTKAQPVTVREVVRQGIEALKTDRDYRSFMLARILMSLATIADPFYIVYAKTKLGAPPATIGLYLGALSAATLVSNFFWSPLADRAGNRTLMAWSAGSVAAVPVTALALSVLAGVTGGAFVYYAFAVVFVLAGFASGAARIVNNNMLLAIAPPDRRPSYIGFLNTMLGVAIFVPVLGGALADVLGFEALFVLSVLFSLLALMASAKMSTARAFS
jgi:MFS family permease